MCQERKKACASRRRKTRCEGPTGTRVKEHTLNEYYGRRIEERKKSPEK